MSWSVWIFIIVSVILVASRMVPSKGINYISAGELKGRLKEKNVQFIDVRTPAEYKGNHIRQFQNIPLHLLKQKASSLDKNKEVVVMCQSGMRSTKACKILKQLGFKKITNVRGGMSSWRP